MKTTTVYDPSKGVIIKCDKAHKLHMGILEQLTEVKMRDTRWGDWSPAREVADTLLAYKEGEVELQDAYGHIMTVMMAYSLSTHK